MRIIFTSWAWPSHLYAMVPLAWACRAAGHDVLLASQPALTGTLAQCGLPAAPIGRDVDAEGVFRDIATGSPGGGQPGGGPRVLDLLVTLAEAMVDDLTALASGWQADLVVYEPTAFAGPLAAAALGVPAVRHLYGTDLMSVVGRFLPAALEPLCRKLGLDPVDPFGAATVDPCPGELQVPLGSRRLPMRYVPHNGPGVLPRPRPGRSGRPQVCVTWGTTMSRLDPALFLAGAAARAIEGLDVDILLAVTPDQRASLGALPRRARVVESAPLHQLLPECDAVIAHGGAGSLLTSIDHGLPQLLVPRLPDHQRHAARLAETGAGIVVPAPELEPAVLRDRLHELLTTPDYRASAMRLRAEMHSQPTPAELVSDLESIRSADTEADGQPVTT
jgi:UDP:flavonoid glycosyltransferase YjiC (YdhE family)